MQISQLCASGIKCIFVFGSLLCYLCFLGKFFDLSNNSDIEAVLDLLNESDVDFDDDDGTDETWFPSNVIADAQEDSDESTHDDNISSSRNDELATAVEHSNSLAQTTNGRSTQPTRQEICKSIPFPNADLPITSGCQNITTVKLHWNIFKTTLQNRTIVMFLNSLKCMF